jgi:hypothetical protein
MSFPPQTKKFMHENIVKFLSKEELTVVEIYEKLNHQSTLQKADLDDLLAEMVKAGTLTASDRPLPKFKIKPC